MSSSYNLWCSPVFGTDELVLLFLAISEQTFKSFFQKSLHDFCCGHQSVLGWREEWWEGDNKYDISSCQSDTFAFCNCLCFTISVLKNVTNGFLYFANPSSPRLVMILPACHRTLCVFIVESSHVSPLRRSHDSTDSQEVVGASVEVAISVLPEVDVWVSPYFTCCVIRQLETVEVQHQSIASYYPRRYWELFSHSFCLSLSRRVTLLETSHCQFHISATLSPCWGQTTAS